jgi:hypothetical protein
MSLDGGAQKTKEKSRPGSHAKEGSSFKVTTAIVIPLLAIIIPAIVAIYIAKTSGASSVSQPRSSEDYAKPLAIVSRAAISEIFRKRTTRRVKY